MSSSDPFLSDIGLTRRNSKTGRNECTGFGMFLLALGIAAGIAALILASILTANWNSTRTQNVLALNVTNATAPCVVCPAGTNGTDGATGANGTNAVVGFAHFYALMPGDNAATIAVGAPILFPQAGPASATGAPTAANSSVFILPAIGTYEVYFQASITEPGQLMVKTGSTELAYTVAGRATGTSQISNMVLVTTTVINTGLSIVNPTGNSAALTMTLIAGGTHAVSATLLIKRIA